MGYMGYMGYMGFMGFMGFMGWEGKGWEGKGREGKKVGVMRVLTWAGDARIFNWLHGYAEGKKSFNFA